MLQNHSSAAPPDIHDSEIRPSAAGLPSNGALLVTSILRPGASPGSDSRREQRQASNLDREASPPSGSQPSLSPHPHPPASSDRARRRARRRALTACQLCRARKTKCDNVRPSCGYCIFQGAKCIYTDTPLGARVVSPRPSPQPAASSHNGQGPSNEALLDSLNHLTGLVEGLRSELDLRRTFNPTTPGFPATDFPTQFGPQDPSLQPLVNQFGSAHPNTESAFADDGFGRLEVPELAARTSASESILKWPVLAEVYPGENITSFPLQSTIRDEAESLDTAMIGTGGGGSRGAVIHEDNIWPLCRKFLVLINVKNPILDVSEFKRYARQAAECGPTWDGRGCLVLLACALASLSTPYHPMQDPVSEADADYNMSSPSTAALVDESAAEAYYSAAKRRLGLLPTSLISIQCHYFAGLYEKFAIRPLSAWMLLQQACVRFQAYLYAKALSTPVDGAGDVRTARHIEQRLYWLCVKAECELRAELQLPASGLLKFKYPDLFPSLSFPSSSELLDFSDGFAGSTGQSPEATAAMLLGGGGGGGGGGGVGTPSAGPVSSSDRLDPEEERSWLYYLAEIFLRKIMNRILDDVYGRGEQHWVTPVGRGGPGPGAGGTINRSLLSQHAAYSEELALWRAHLPHQLRFSDGEMLPPNELAFFLKTRYLICLEWIARPFLYHVTTTTTATADATTIDPAVAALAQRCVDTCVALIPVIARHHRHGGIWGLLRKSFSLGLLLIAASRRPLVLELPGNWQESVRLVIATIKRWEDGATDLRWMRQTLEGMLAGV